MVGKLPLFSCLSISYSQELLHMKIYTMQENDANKSVRAIHDKHGIPFLYGGRSCLGCKVQVCR